MIRIFTFVALSVSAYVTLMHLALLMRVILGAFTEGTGPLASFVYVATEPILLPIRRYIDKKGILQGIPLDISVLVAMILLTVVSLLLPRITA
ncbi:MAG: YggT family protein [Clostridia bacterium]|nr:YggT family protein [Clostridia bacterium]